MTIFKNQLTKVFLFLVFLGRGLPALCQNCNVDFQGTADRNFSASCGDTSSSNLTLGKTTYMGNGDVFTFNSPVINITGNVEVNAQGSGKIIIPAGVAVTVGGNFQINSNSSGCSASNPCTFEIVVNGTLHIDQNFQNNIVTIIWSGSGTVIVNDHFENSSNGCMTCGTGECPSFNVGSGCSDNGSGCSAGDFCTTISVCSSDAAKPVITGCPPDQTVMIAGPGCTHVATWIAPTASDNCMLSSFASNYSSGHTFPKGITTVIYTATDAAGNMATCSFNVTVVDNILPVITGCPSNVTVNILKDVDSTCTAVANWVPPIVIDNCGAVNLTSSHHPGDTFSIGNTQVTYTATDKHGNVSYCVFNVIVKNENLPIISNCPDDITLTGNETNMASVDWIIPTASAQCGEVTMKGSHQPGDFFNVGTTKIEYRATDGSGNTSYCRFNVIVSQMQIEIDISKVVTPDGNGINDEWIITNIEKFKDNKVVVVDRWGGVIFTGTGYNNQNIVWRGTNRSGGPVPTGTYFFTLTMRFGDRIVEKNGFIELIR